MSYIEDEQFLEEYKDIILTYKKVKDQKRRAREIENVTDMTPTLNDGESVDYFNLKFDAYRQDIA